MSDEDLEESLISVLGRSGGKDLLFEASEYSLDAVLEAGVIKDIPVIGTVAKLYSMAIGVRGYIFAKKIRSFLTELSSVPLEKREEFISSLENDAEQKILTAETLIILLDKLDDMRKAPLLSRAFAGYVREEYDFTTFQRLAVAVDRSIVSDLHILEKASGLLPLDGYIGDMLVGTGLLSVSSTPEIKGPGVKTTYELSNLGELFVQVVLKGLPRDD